MPRITNLELNANTAKAITRRVLKDRNMEIKSGFSPVESEYMVQLTPKKRIILNLSEDTFTTREEKLTSRGWKETVTGIFRGRTGEDASEMPAFENTVSFINDYVERFSRKRK